ncbi:MAG: SIMPL domain-containing protein [Methanocorpusculum sp.]|nr:SIMPL domain-containing protein [Methanocorpusculum sp.]
MKKILMLTLAVFAVLALLALPVSAVESSPADRVILVTGNGESTTTPDMLTITFGVETTDTDVKAAQNQNTEQMNKIVAAMKAAGVKDENIKTNRYTVYSYEISEYNAGKWPQGTTVYEVTSSVEVVSYDINAAGSLIEKAVNAGANKINSLSFGLSNEKKIMQRNAALVSAVKAARADADAVSGALGLKITGTGTVSVNQNYDSVTYPNIAMKEAVAYASGSADAAAPDIQAGSLKTTATVSVVYTY